MAAWESSTEKWLKLWWTWRKLYGLTFLHFSLDNNEFIEPICGEKPVISPSLTIFLRLFQDK